MSHYDSCREAARQAKRVGLGIEAAPANDALREIAGRLKRLSYRDMVAVASALATSPDAVLRAADTLETA